MTYRKVAELKPYARNSRTHTSEQIDAIVASIREFGWTNPVLVDSNGGVIAGHGRVLAAQRLGLTEVPVIELGHLTDAQRRALVIADNRLAERAGWDKNLLALELADLKALGYDLTPIGFEPADLEGIFARGAAHGDPERVPDVSGPTTACRGDVWLLGKHRLACGDSTNVVDVNALLRAAKPHLMVTDPPYGVDYDPDWRNRADRSNGKKIGARALGQVENDDKADWRQAWRLFPGDVAYVWHAGTVAHISGESLVACGFKIRAQIIWAKSNIVIGRGHYHHRHEPCWYAVRDGSTGHWEGGRKQATVWNIEKRQKHETGHSTQKPVECMKLPIENNSRAGDGVYEPFSGSGTTIIAAEMTGRVCYAMEVAPRYVDMAILRWQEFTGQTATRERDGVAFKDARPAPPRAKAAAKPKGKRRAGQEAHVS